MNICRENPYFLKIGRNFRPKLHEDISRFCNTDHCDVVARMQYKGTDISMTASAYCTLLTAECVAYC